MQPQEPQDSQEPQTPAEAPSDSLPEPLPSEPEAPEETVSPEEGEEAAAPEEKPETPEGKQKRGGYQRKIERLERERQILLEQLNVHRGQPPSPAAPPKEKAPAEQAQEYVNSMIAKGIAEHDAKRQAQAQQAEFEKRAVVVRAKRPDFDEVTADAIRALDTSGNQPTAQAISQLLLTSEEGPEILYQLAENPAELARISALPPLFAAREIVRLEAKSASGASPQKPNGTAIRPPAPPSKVAGSVSSTRSLESLPISEYKRLHRSGRR